MAAGFNRGPDAFWDMTPRELQMEVLGLDDRWRAVKELAGFATYHAGLALHMKKPPTLRSFMACLIPRPPPTTEELGRKLDATFRALQARARRQAAIEKGLEEGEG